MYVCYMYICVYIGGGVLLNLLTYQWMSKQSSKPLLCDSGPVLNSIIKMYNHPDNLKIDWKLLTGSALFGVG